MHVAMQFAVHGDLLALLLILVSVVRCQLMEVRDPMHLLHRLDRPFEASMRSRRHRQPLASELWDGDTDGWRQALSPSERSALVLAGLQAAAAQSAALGANTTVDAMWCQASPQVGSPRLPLGPSAALKASRRARIRWYLLPSNPIHVCAAPYMIVQSMQRDYKYRCQPEDVFSNETRDQIHNEVMPRMMQWLLETLLIDDAERRTPGRLFPDEHLGVCEAQLGSYVPRMHKGGSTVVGPIGPVDPYTTSYRSPSLNPAWSALNAAYGVLANTSASFNAARTSSRGTYRGRGASDGAVDLVLYVTTMTSTYFIDAMPCQFHPLTGRPTVLHLNIDPAFLRLEQVSPPTSAANYEVLTRLALRLVLQSLALKNFFLDLNPTQYTTGASWTASGRRQCNQSEVFVASTRPEGLTVQGLIREPLRSIAQAFFGCNTLQSVELEVIDASYMVTFQNLGSRSYSGELLTHAPTDTILSDRTYGVVQSSGWWGVDWSSGALVREPNAFGASGGCRFGNNLCNASFDRLLPRGATYVGTSKPPDAAGDAPNAELWVDGQYAAQFGTAAAPNMSAIDGWAYQTMLSNASTLADTPFCFDATMAASGPPRCHVQRRGTAYCRVVDYGQPLPPSMQYFSTPSWGGSSARRMYCPMVELGYTACSDVLAAMMGAADGGAPPSPYDDMFCLDRLERRQYNLTWRDAGGTGNASLAWTVLAKADAGCFRVTDCDVAQERYAVRSPTQLTTGGSWTWPVVHWCRNATDVFATTYNRSTTTSMFQCAPFASVCHAWFQRHPNLLPRGNVEAAANAEQIAVPSLSMRRFPYLDVQITLGNVSAASTTFAWWAASGTTEQAESVLAAVNASKWSFEPRPVGDGNATAAIAVPLRVMYSLPLRGMAPLGGVLIVALTPEHRLTCDPTFGGNNNNATMFMDLWPLSENISGTSTSSLLLQRAVPGALGEVWAFVVVADVASSPDLFETETVRCHYLLRPDDVDEVDMGDPGVYAEISFLALQPARVVMNASTGLYDALLPNATALQASMRSGMLNVSNAFASVNLPWCGNPQDAPPWPPTAAATAADPTLQFEKIAVAYNINALSDDVSPLLPFATFAGGKNSVAMGLNRSAALAARAIGASSISDVVASLINMSTYTSGNVSAGGTSGTVRIALLDVGTAAPNVTVQLTMDVPEFKTGVVIAVSVSVPVPSANGTGHSAMEYGLQYTGPVTPLVSLLPILDSVQLVGSIHASCPQIAETGGIGAAATTFLEQQRSTFATACPQPMRLPARVATPTTSVVVEVEVFAVENLHSAAARCALGNYRTNLSFAVVAPTFLLRLPSAVGTAIAGGGPFALTVNVTGFQYTAVTAAAGAQTRRMLARMVADVAVFWPPTSGSHVGLPMLLLQLDVSPASSMLLATSTELADFRLAISVNATCSRCLTFMYFELYLPDGNGLRRGDSIRVRLDDTQYRRDQMVAHPAWGFPGSATVALGCPNTTLFVRDWRAQQIMVEIEGPPTRGPASSAASGSVCVPLGGRIGFRLDGFYAVGTSPTFAPTVADVQVILNGSTAVYRSPVPDVPVSTTCALCNHRGTCVTTTRCSCFAGYGGSRCDICSSHAMDVPGSACVHWCDAMEGPAPPDVPPRYRTWVADCIAVGGWLNPQDACRCYCNGSVCFDVTPSRLSVSATQTVEMTPTASKTITHPIAPPPTGTNTAMPSPTPSGSGGTITDSPTAVLTTSTESSASTQSMSPTATSFMPTTESVAPTTTPVGTATAAPSSTSGSQPFSTTAWPPSTSSTDPTTTQSPSQPQTFTNAPSSSESSTQSSATTPSASTTTGPVPTGTLPLTDVPSSTPSGSSSPPTVVPRTPSPHGPHTVTLSISDTDLRTVTATESNASIGQTVSESVVLYPADPKVNAVVSYYMFSTGGSSLTLSDAIRGGLSLAITSTINVIEAVYNQYLSPEVLRSLSETVQSPISIVSTTSYSLTLVRMEVGGLVWNKRLLAVLYVPLIQYRPAMCRSDDGRWQSTEDAMAENRSAWNSTWNASVTGSNVWVTVPTDDIRYVVDLFAYGPVMRTCYNAVFLGAPDRWGGLWHEMRSQVVYLVVAAPDSDEPYMRLVTVAQQVHCFCWIAVYVALLAVAPQLLLDVQLMALLSAVSLQAPSGCFDGTPPTLYATLLPPELLQWVLLPLAAIPALRDTTVNDFSDTYCFHVAAALGVLMVLLFGAVDRPRDVSLWSALRASASTFAFTRWWYAHACVWSTGLVFAFGRSMIAASQMDQPTGQSIVGYCTMPLVAAAVVGCLVYLWRVGVDSVLSRDVFDMHYTVMASLGKARHEHHKASTTALHRELARGVPRTLMWSKRLAVCVAAWFPPLWAVPRGYWHFRTPMYALRAPIQVLHIVDGSPTMPASALSVVRGVLVRYTPFVQFARNVVVATLLGLGGADKACMQVTRTAVPTRGAELMPFDVSFFVALVVVLVWLMHLLLVHPFRSRAYWVVSVWVAGSVVLLGALMRLGGTTPLGGMYDGSIHPETKDNWSEVLAILLLLLDACLVVLVLYLALEHVVLDAYFEEVDRTVQSQYRHRNALEACFIEAVPMQNVQDDCDPTLFTELVDVEPLRGAHLSDDDDNAPDVIAPFSPLERLRQLVHDEAQRERTRTGRGKRAKRGAKAGRGVSQGRRRGNGAAGVLRPEDGSSDDSTLSSGGDTPSGQEAALDGTMSPPPNPIAEFAPQAASSGKRPKPAKQRSSKVPSQPDDNLEVILGLVPDAAAARTREAGIGVGMDRTTQAVPLDRTRAAKLWNR